MPAVVVAVAGIAAGVAVATGVGFVAGTMAYAITAGVTSMVVSSVVGSALGGNEQPQQQQANAAAEMARGILVNTASTVDAIQVIYGSRRIGGTRVLAEVSGTNNEYLNLVICHCEGPVSAINTVYLDGTASTDAKFSGLVDIEKHLGGETTASAALMAELPGVWTSAHVGNNVAYTWVRLRYDRNVFRGVPVITADIDGRTVYDVRDGLTKFSSNSSLCIRDYLTNTLYGRGIPTANLDAASWIASANTCDITYTDPASVARPQHTCNGVVDTDQNSTENIRSLLTSCRGTLLFSARGYGLLIDKAETPTTFEFNEDNIVGSWSIGAGSKRTRFNRVRGNWFNPDREWQPDIWPADSPTFRTTDNGLLLEAQLPMPFTSNAYEAQIKTERHMRQSRFGKTLAFRATIAGMDCEVGDVVPVTHTTPGYTSKPFRVQVIRLFSSDEVEVEMTEYDASVYSDTPLTTPRVSPDTNLPDPYTVAAPGIPTVTESLFETTGSAGVKARATVSWVASADAFIDDYLPEYRVASGTWISLPSERGVFSIINDIAPGNYEFRLRVRNTMGVVSAYSGTRSQEILGLTAAPTTPTGFTVIKSAGFALATWALSTDLDVIIGGRNVIRHSPQTSGAAWEDGVIVEEFNGDAVSGYVALMTGTYLIKALDSSGNYSSTAASFAITEGTVTGWTTVATTTQEPTFAGAKTNTEVAGGALKLSASTLFDDMITLFDDWNTFDILGGISSAGSYAFDAAVDLTTVATRRFEADISALSFDAEDYIDSHIGLVDTWGPIDGGVVNNCDVTLYAAITNDDPAGAPTWSDWMPFFVADFTCRAAKFKLDFVSGSTTNNISVSTLAVDIKVPA